MALPILRVGAEISFKGACGKTVEATGPQPNEVLKRDAKPALDMSKITKIMSEVSTAPPSPTMSFVRCISSERESVIDSENGSAILMEQDCGADDSANTEQSEDTVENEGIMWTVTRGAPPSIEKLESSLMDVKALIKAKFGNDVDAEDSDSKESEDNVEKDGIMWTVTRGSPPSIEKLESSLVDVKALYKAKFGKDVDAEDSDSEEGEHAVEKEGIMWTVIRGASPSIEKLESSLVDVKTLYKAKFGKDVDAEDSDSEEGEHAVEKEGIMWTVTRGAPPSIEKLESSLMDLKALYKAKCGKDVDAEASDNMEGEHAVEKEGIMWTVTRGAPPSIEKLESSLVDVKALYTAKFGKDVDAEDSDSEESEPAAKKEGIMRTVSRALRASIVGRSLTLFKSSKKKKGGGVDQ